MKVVYVTGCLGFIGSYVTRACLKKGWYVKGVDKMTYAANKDLLVEFKKYPNFKLIKEDEQKGVYNAWNIGIKSASTEYVTNWNIDDLRHPINTKIKYDAITKNNIDMVYNWYAGTRDENLNFYNAEDLQPQVMFPDEYDKHVMTACLAGPDPLWKKSLHDRVGLFDGVNFKSIADWEMWIRFAKEGAKFKLIPAVLCIYLDHDNTVSQTNLNKVETEKQQLYEKYR